MKNISTYIYILLLLSGDLISKYIFYDLRVRSELDVIVPLLNTGVARSIPIPQVITLISTICMVLVGIYMWKKGYIYTYIGAMSSRMIYICDIALVLIVSGALGNFYDRVVYDGVRDFININVGFLSDLSYPIFNLADIYIVVGTILLMYVVYISEQNENPMKQ